MSLDRDGSGDASLGRGSGGADVAGRGWKHVALASALEPARRIAALVCAISCFTDASSAATSDLDACTWLDEAAVASAPAVLCVISCLTVASSAPTRLSIFARCRSSEEAMAKRNQDWRSAIVATGWSSK